MNSERSNAQLIFCTIKNGFGMHNNIDYELVSNNGFKCIELEETKSYKSLLREKLISCIIKSNEGKFME